LELADRGTPVHANGIFSIPCLYFNGFPWLRTGPRAWSTARCGTASTLQRRSQVVLS